MIQNNNIHFLFSAYLNQQILIWREYFLSTCSVDVWTDNRLTSIFSNPPLAFKVSLACVKLQHILSSFDSFTVIANREKMIKIATPKEHPYSSHISKFAMFPSFRSPDDPETGVRAAFQPFLNPLIPNCAPDMTLLSKTMGKRAACCGKRGWYMFPERLKMSLLPCTGAPYRHEVLDTPMATRTKAATWNGEHGFLDVSDAQWIHITSEVIQ